MQNSIIGVFYFFEICLWNGVIAEKPSKKGVILSKVTRFYGTYYVEVAFFYLKKYIYYIEELNYDDLQFFLEQ